VSEKRLCIGQEKVKEKSNEITALLNVLDSLSLSESTVSIDAIGTQTAIADKLLVREGITSFRSKAISKDS
jgi:predicted transposase YbfD/YdcC